VIEVGDFIAGRENALVPHLLSSFESGEATYSPIVVYGVTGVGKSTLVHALDERFRPRQGTVIMTTGADLARGLAHALETGAAADFRTRHQRCDLLAVDGLHQLAAKPAALQFFQTTLDALLRRGSLVIVTLSQPPPQTTCLPPALVSRLMGGLLVPLALPGYAARCELVRRTSRRIGIAVSEETIARLAGSPQRPANGLSTPGRLQHAVMQLGATTAASGSDQAGALEKLLTDKAPPLKTVCNRVASLVARQAGFTSGELKGKSRRQAVADARSLAMYLARRLTGASYAQIGRHFGDRDHTTVLYACRKVLAAAKTDDVLLQTAEDLASQVAASLLT
jgi:chromosomal replication initiator protein